jgi:hypothetical protein
MRKAIRHRQELPGEDLGGVLPVARMVAEKNGLFTSARADR